MTKSIDKPIDRFKVLVKGKDKAGEFYRKSFAGMFAYVSNRIQKYQMNYTKLMML
jgi:3-hydroxyacyl-CoA dehydrogenase